MAKSKVDMATFWTQAVKDPFRLFKKFYWFWKVLLIKHKRNSGEKDKEKEEERESIKRPEKKEKEESPRGAERGKRLLNA